MYWTARLHGTSACRYGASFTINYRALFPDEVPCDAVVNGPKTKALWSLAALLEFHVTCCLIVLNRNKMDSCVFFARSKTIPNNNFSCILLPGTQLSSRCTWSKNLGLAIRHNILAEHTISFRPETCYSHVSSEPKEVKRVICQKFWQWENQIVQFFGNFCQKADATHDWTLCRFTYNCLTSLRASLQQFSCHWFCVDMISAFLTQNEFGGRGHISRVFGKFRRQEIFVSQDVGNICVQCNHVDSV